MNQTMSTLAACGLALLLVGCGSRDGSTAPLALSQSATALTSLTSTTGTTSSALPVFDPAPQEVTSLATVRGNPDTQEGTTGLSTLHPAGETSPANPVAPGGLLGASAQVKVHCDVIYNGGVGGLAQGDVVLNAGDVEIRPSRENLNTLFVRLRLPNHDYEQELTLALASDTPIRAGTQLECRENSGTFVGLVENLSTYAASFRSVDGEVEVVQQTPHTLTLRYDDVSLKEENGGQQHRTVFLHGTVSLEY